MPSTTLLMQQIQGHKKYFSWGAGKPWENALHITSNYNFPSTIDGPTVVKYLKGLTINTGCTVTTSTRCKGLVLFIDGDCIINGILQMTARGANAVGANLAIDYKNAEFLTNPINWNTYEYKISSAGSGGSGSSTNKNGTVSSNYSCGGGGGGGISHIANPYIITNGGNGGAGTCYSGGAGGGGAGNNGYNHVTVGGNAASNGGAGGAGTRPVSPHGVMPGGGGAGNPGGTSQQSAGSNGTGGLLILVVKGKLVIGSSGIIRSNGSNGGSAKYLNDVGGFRRAGNGAGSGGGSINILYSDIYQNSGTIQANGGVGGSAVGGTGGSGGAGSIRVSKIIL